MCCLVLLTVWVATGRPWPLSHPVSRPYAHICVCCCDRKREANVRVLFGFRTGDWQMNSGKKLHPTVALFVLFSFPLSPLSWLADDLKMNLCIGLIRFRVYRYVYMHAQATPTDSPPSPSSLSSLSRSLVRVRVSCCLVAPSPDPDTKGRVLPSLSRPTSLYRLVSSFSVLALLPSMSR